MNQEDKALLRKQLTIPGLVAAVEQLLNGTQKVYKIFGITGALIESQNALWFQFHGALVETGLLQRAIPFMTELPFSRLFEKPASLPDYEMDGPETSILQHLFAQPLFAEAVDTMRELGRVPTIKVIKPSNQISFAENQIDSDSQEIPNLQQVGEFPNVLSSDTRTLH